MADQSIRGRFVWHELTTPDTAGAQGFYTKALGWTTQAWDQDPSYQMFAAASGPLGGVTSDPNGAPSWLSYISSPDVAATLEQVKSLGGKVVKGPESLPSGGVYAIAADPQGATFGVYGSPNEAGGKESAPKRGEFSWHELATTDYRAAFDFYSKVFGWERIVEHDMGPLGVYFIFGSKGVQRGGIYNKPAEMPGPANWLAYVRVKDVNQTAKKIKSARGSLVNGPMEVPGGDWIAQFTDPYGAMFAVHTLAADVKKDAAAAPAEAAAPAPAQAAPAAAEPPAKKAAKPAAKKAAKPAARKAAKKPAKKAGKAKAAPKRKAGGKKKAVKKGGKKKAAAKGAKRPARKAAGKKKAGKKKAARRKK